MCAFAIDSFGQTPVKEMSVPEPGSGEVQIEIRAAAVNPIDWKPAAGAFSRPAWSTPSP
ncbi:hypothetical protein ACF1G0_22465 [Streptomyces sp. NPDC013953]|uniref:hypothetical protein n=1 Tax=Streptomyces sp. NPDC013953 TaxID=3364868 RepID=UPI0036FD6560